MQEQCKNKMTDVKKSMFHVKHVFTSNVIILHKIFVIYKLKHEG